MAQHLRKPDWLKIRLGGMSNSRRQKVLLNLIAFTQYAQVVNARIWVNVGAGEQLHS